MLGLPGLVTRLWDDALGVVRAELELAKSRIFDRLRRSRTAIILLVAALVLVFAGIVGFVVGLVVALTPLVGGALAGLIVLMACMVIAGLLAWFASRQFRAPNAQPAVTEAGS